MTDTAKWNAVRAEFYGQAAATGARHTHLHVLVADNMTSEIVRLRQRAERAERILNALEEPSEAVVNTAWENFISRGVTWKRDISDTIRAAVVAAEQEVGRE